jgi:isocitrate dehydrogenase
MRSLPIRATSVRFKTDDLVKARAEAAKQELSILAQAFNRYDGDGRGALDARDLQKALTELDMGAGEVEVSELFDKLDVNHDGTVELQEWLDNMPSGTKLRILQKADEFGDLIKFEIPDVKIIYTYTDEAPMLATYSLLPVFRSFCRFSGVKIMKKDISLAGRILANFPDYLLPSQRAEDSLEELGSLAKHPAANIVKLPNISASVPQLVAAIAELQAKGYAVPDFPADPKTDDEAEIRSRYAKVLGSAVNPVLREGNSDRRVAVPVKAYAQKNPPRNGEWSPDSKSCVATMSDGDFFGSEQSYISEDVSSVRIELVNSAGQIEVLKAKTPLLSGEIIDASYMCVEKLRNFYQKEIDSTEPGTLFSLHLKATMMKVSDPIFFKHCVEVFYKEAFEKHRELFEELGVTATNGIGDAYAKIAGHPKQAEVEADLKACLEKRPEIAHVDSRRGITNLHVPSDVIVDASMAAAVRDSGRMWSKDDELVDTKFVVPDRCYSGIYSAVIEDCKKNGKLDAAQIGATSNVGLMAAKAEEYGSHDKTFVIPEAGKVQVVDRKTKEVLMSHDVCKGDVWRMCQTKDGPIKDWVKLAVARARSTGVPAVFWLTEERAHDRNVIKKVHQYLKLHDTTGCDIQVLAPEEAMKFTLERARKGLDTITVTGNVLRDYLTDLFPILELGTSAKMLSIVPLLAGGGMFETGAGGSAPKHVQQFQKEGHLRWDSLGEFLAMGCALEDVSQKTNNPLAKVMADTLTDAVGKLMNEGKSPKRRVMELDNRGSHFYLALFWAEALGAQTDSEMLQERFKPVAAQLKTSEARILGELIAAEGRPQDMGGYYYPDPFLASQAMRPSPTFNSIVDAVLAASGF